MSGGLVRGITDAHARVVSREYRPHAPCSRRRAAAVDRCVPGASRSCSAVPEARAASTNSTSRKQAAEHDRARITVCITRHGARPARGGERTFREKVSPTARAPQRAHGRLGPFGSARHAAACAHVARSRSLQRGAHVADRTRQDVAKRSCPANAAPPRLPRSAARGAGACAQLRVTHLLRTSCSCTGAPQRVTAAQARRIMTSAWPPASRAGAGQRRTSAQAVDAATARGLRRRQRRVSRRTRSALFRYGAASAPHAAARAARFTRPHPRDYRHITRLCRGGAARRRLAHAAQRFPQR
jgi:hypothetical protein